MRFVSGHNIGIGNGPCKNSVCEKMGALAWSERFNLKGSVFKAKRRRSA